MPFLPQFTSLDNSPLVAVRAESPTAPAEIVSSWVLEPDGRGTFAILRSCIITLALCVYTAIHLNIPAATDKKRAIYLRKAKWVAIAMFAPELVVYVAWCQRKNVFMLHGKVLDGLKKHEARKQTTTRRKHPWTIKHSWYGYMGGFVIDTTPKPSEDAIIEGSPRVALREHALHLLAIKGWLPDLPVGEIEDKSKADGLAKSLAAVQSAWMILQCIMRWSSGLYVTSLELNTLAHAICALVIFILWWDKPLDIQHPTVLTGDWTRPLAAYLWVAAYDKKPEGRLMTKWLFANQPKEVTECESEERTFFWVEPGTLPSDDSREPDMACDMTRDQRLDRQPQATQSLSTYRVQIDRVRIFNWETGVYSSRTFQHSASSGGLETLAFSPRELVVLPHTTVGIFPGESQDQSVCQIERSFLVRWKVVWDWVRSSQHDELRHDGFLQFELNQGYPPLWSRNEIAARVQWARIKERYYISKLICAWVPNWYDGIDELDKLEFSSSLVFIACAVVYGAIHAAAWNQHFHFNIERLLWKVSCIYIPSAGIAVLPLIYVWYLMSRASHKTKLEKETGVDKLLLKLLSYLYDNLKGKPDLLFQLLRILIWPLMLAYLLGRIYLVVEAFISLRSVPQSAYQTPDWTEYLPHL
ncbi:hypothetical protein QBC43DRAFT_323439 [Cladorrhinum sp. PSN259]|nr:hypothetical protein QBC43DRAFT_323439 [Cladorrhinum sp. PSN259]